MRMGQRNDDVAFMQRALANSGIYEGRIDGYYGPLTYLAAKHYQRVRGLRSDGWFGPVTQRDFQSLIRPLNTDESMADPVIPYFGDL